MIEVLSSRLEARAAGIDVPPLIDVTPEGEVVPAALPAPAEPKKPTSYKGKGRKMPNPIADYVSIFDSTEPLPKRIRPKRR
jgi:hypothetical protein